MGQDAEALRLYEELLGVATLPDYRARLLSEAAELADALGQTDRAQAWQREIISTAPYSALAVAAVERLLAEGDPALSPAEAARVYFNAERYTDAVPLFDAALQQAPAGSEEALELRRLRALAIRGQGDFGATMDELARLADDSPPGSDADLQARLDWIQTLGQSGEVDQAAWRYYEYSHTYPTDQRAPEALERAAQLRARLGQTQEAMQIRGELGQRYPQSEQAAPALQQAAWHYYGSARYDTARDMWLLLTQNDEAYEQARGAFWAGRISRSQGDETQARSLFEQAYAAAPDSYYGFRAAEELGISFDGAVPLGAPFSAADWQALATWVDTWATPTNNNSNGAEQAAEAEAVLPEVANSGFVQRAVALRDVGLQVESVGEWNSARDAWDSDPVRLMWLARLAHEHHEPYTALKAATRLQMLAPAEASPVPQTLERLIYPTPYAPLVVAESRAFDVDPRLLYSLMRQESLFNPGATSWVGARGLAQVMPATGEGIAQNLGVADFHIDDLYRPAVSVRFGAYYIGQSMSSMEGSIHGGLAAYNGGLGNAYRWAGGGSSVADADLFTEFIDYPETETYIKRVYGYYGTYQRLYTLP
jgi:soluble lytic murein transglycosylase